MTVQQMIELVQQHHPSMGETEIIKMLNLAMADFSIKTRMIKDTVKQALTIDKRHYDLADATITMDEVIEVERVEMDAGDGFGTKIPRLMTPPNESDYDEWEAE